MVGEERYGSHQGYVKAVTEQAKTLVAERFLLDEDAARVVKESETGQVLAAGAPSSR
jgi:alpha/beta hydrolase family protein